MKRLVILTLILVLVRPNLALAQDNRTQTYDDGTLSFLYPEGWILQFDEEQGSINVSNMPFGEGDTNILADIPPGTIRINVSYEDIIPDEEKSFFPDDPDLTFLLGYIAGFVALAVQLQNSLSDEPVAIDFGELESMQVGERTVQMIEMKLTSHDALFSVTDLDDTWMFLIAYTPAGELDQWRSVTLAIMETAEYHD